MDNVIAGVCDISFTDINTQATIKFNKIKNNSMKWGIDEKSKNKYFYLKFNNFTCDFSGLCDVFAIDNTLNCEMLYTILNEEGTYFISKNFLLTIKEVSIGARSDNYATITIQGIVQDNKE